MNINISTPSYASRAYSPSNFSATGGSFIPSSTDYLDRYKVIGKILFWELTVEGTIGSLPSEILVTLPNGYSARNNGGAISSYVEGQSVCTTVFSGTQLSIRKIDGTDFTNGATYIYINITLEIV